MTARQETVERGRSYVPLAAGIAMGATSIGLYAADGYGRAVGLLWLAGFLVLFFSFERQTAGLPRLALRDVGIAIGLGAVFIPLYVVGSYSWPVQVNSDEIVIMHVSERWGAASGIDPFGLSDYFTLPALLFVIWGHLGALLGGVELGNMRVLHGSFGLLTIAASYALFRQLLPRGWAVFAACVLGANHAFFMFGRMATRENTAVLIEVVALALLLQGLRRQAPGPTFLGGAIAGLGFYVYYPGRTVYVLWLIFLTGLAVLFRKTVPLARLARYGAISLTGFILVAGPVFIAEQNAPAGAVSYQGTAWLLTPEGRQLQKEWVGASSEWGGIKTNILNGLTTFNNSTVDHSWLYPNYGHGFVDPLTGGLLWLGLLATAWGLYRRRDTWEPLLPVSAFLTIWLTLSLLINKAPNYSRLLIALPFVAYFVTQAVRFLVSVVRPRVERRLGAPWAKRIGAAFAVAVLVGVVAWNLSIAYDFIDRGRKLGDDIGSTGRYIAAERNISGKHFYLAASDRYPYYVWGWPSIWEARMRAFAHDGQVGKVVTPSKVGEFEASPPFSLFMSRQLWTDRAAVALRRRYPRALLHDVTPDGRLVVFEVQARHGLGR
jgi:hypothetical protein